MLRAAQQTGLLGRPAVRTQARHPGSTLTVDSTGLAARYVSAYYTQRQGQRGPQPTRRHPKLTAVVDAASHLVLGAIATRGPSHDAPQFGPVVRQAAAQLAALGVPVGCLLADAGYDAEPHHVLCREALAIPRVIINVNRRGAGRPRARYRRALDARFPRRAYGQRWHVESAFSQHKRRLGDALTARHPLAQRHEVLLRVLTHNLLILWCAQP